MAKLPNDVCRCAGVKCDKKEHCLRYTDLPDENAFYTPFAANLCAVSPTYFILDEDGKKS